VCGRAFVRVCVCACMRDCHSSSLARHAPLLLSSSTRTSTLPLILEMRRSSPGPQYASLVLLCLTRPSCRAPFLLCDRAVQRLAPVTCRSRASGARDRVADLAEAAGARRCVLQSVTCPAQPGPADAAVATPLSSPPPLLLERRRTSWLRRPATCFPPLWPCPAEAPIYSLA